MTKRKLPKQCKAYYHVQWLEDPNDLEAPDVPVIVERIAHIGARHAYNPNGQHITNPVFSPELALAHEVKEIADQIELAESRLVGLQKRRSMLLRTYDIVLANVSRAAKTVEERKAALRAIRQAARGTEVK